MFDGQKHSCGAQMHLRLDVIGMIPRLKLTGMWARTKDLPNLFQEPRELVFDVRPEFGRRIVERGISKV